MSLRVFSLSLSVILNAILPVGYGAEPWFCTGEYEDGVDDMGYREFYTRWFQYGALLSILRVHGTDIRREIGTFSDVG